VLIVVLPLAYYLKKRKSPPNDGLPRQLPGREIGNLPIFSYEALRQTTNFFHEENEIAIGGLVLSATPLFKTNRYGSYLRVTWSFSSKKSSS
jgi:hypothetical protein